VSRKRFYCALCEEWIEHDAPTDSVYEGIEAGSDHFRVLHPDVYEQIGRWPDGAPVVVDNSLTADDFAASPDAGTESE
jgi:hypothetical protein